LYYVNYVSSPNTNGDRLVVGSMALSTLSELQTYIPLPSATDQQFCGLVNIAPGVLAHTYIPTAAERQGDFSADAISVIDPLSNVPFPGSIIPYSRLGPIFAFRISGLAIYQQPAFAITNVGSGKVLDVTNLSKNDGALLQQWDDLGGENQRWLPQLISEEASGGFNIAFADYNVVNTLSQKVLDVVDLSTIDGARIQQWSNLGAANQQWQFEHVDSLHYKIVNRLSGLTLDVQGYSTANGASLQQWNYLGGDNQKWQFVADIRYKILNQASGKALDVQNFSPANGAAVQQWNYLGGTNQQWLLVPVDDEHVRIENVLSHKVLDVTGMSTTSGVAIQQWQYLGGDNQMWELVNVDGQNYEIVNKLSGNVLDVRGQAIGDGAVIQQSSDLGLSSQRWQIVALAESTP
jgi:hypothetical protein